MALTNYASMTEQTKREIENKGEVYNIQQRIRHIEEGVAVCHSVLDQMGAALPTTADANAIGPGGDGLLATLDRTQQTLNRLLERVRTIADLIGQF